MIFSEDRPNADVFAKKNKHYDAKRFQKIPKQNWYFSEKNRRESVKNDRRVHVFKVSALQCNTDVILTVFTR